MSLVSLINDVVLRIGSEIKAIKSNYLLSSSYTASDVLSKIKTVDGAGSGLDADTVDGKHLSEILEPIGPRKVSQAAHGFGVGTCIKMSGTNWVRTKADNAANAGTTAIVSSVVDANNFYFVEGGFVPGSYTVEADYFLSTTTAGAVMTLANPEVWGTGQVREYIGTGVTGGLMVNIDLGDIISDEIIENNFVTGLSFNETTRVLTLTRNGLLSPLSIAIPFPPDDLVLEARDVTKGLAQTYVLDMKASWPYTIQGVVTESDGTLSACSVKINSTLVTGLNSLSIGIKTEVSATGANAVAAGDLVTINTSTSYSGNPTWIRVKLKFKRSI